MVDSTEEIAAGRRFAFGANWASFAGLVDEERIAAASAPLTKALGTNDLAGLSLLDVGCGSGLFSLAAHRLGARVHAFDFDPASVAAAAELRRRFAADGGWTVETGSILDPDYVAGLGQFDIVYSWGVLHHTGRLWDALAAAADLVAPHGRLFVSIYNDQGLASRNWRRVKRLYNRSGRAGRRVLVTLSGLYLSRYRPLWALFGRAPAATTRRARGMDHRHDLIDWVGGYPFEVARPDEVFRFVAARGFELRHLTTRGGGLGCNEYVFERVGGPAA